MKMNVKITAIITALACGSLSAQTDSLQTERRSTTTRTVETETVTTMQPVNNSATNTPDEEKDRYVLRHGELGLRYMPTFSSLRLRNAGGETVHGQLTMSHGWGIMGAFNFNHHIGLQAELNYHEINQQFKDQGLDRQVSVSYLNLPVLLSLNTDKASTVNLNFVVGPQFGFNVGGEVTGNSNGNTEQATATVGAKAGDVGAAYGAGLEFILNPSRTLRLDVGFRGYYGLVDMSASESNTGSSSETYNVLLKASRKTYAGYLGLTWLF